MSDSEVNLFVLASTVSQSERFEAPYCDALFWKYDFSIDIPIVSVFFLVSDGFVGHVLPDQHVSTSWVDLVNTCLALRKILNIDPHALSSIIEFQVMFPRATADRPHEWAHLFGKEPIRTIQTGAFVVGLLYLLAWCHVFAAYVLISS